MAERTDVKIFIASSGELSAFRDESTNVIVEINKSFPHLHLEPVLFELDTASGNNPGFGRIQDKINPLLDKSDIVVTLFYSRVGEFTREEFDRAKNQDKKIFLYLKTGFQPTSSQESSSYAEVLKLKEEVESESEVRYQKFDDIKSYHGMFYIDLHKHISETYPSDDIESQIIISPISVNENKLNLYPKPKPYFIGREAELEEFKHAIDNGDNFIVVDGPGGIGKTQFISKCIEEYIEPEKIIWFTCTTASQFDTLISEAGYPELLKGSSKTDKEKFSAFNDKIQENEYCLFLDNFQETNSNPVFKEFLVFIQEYLKKGCVIVLDRDDIRSVNLTPKRILIDGFKENKLQYAKVLITHRFNDVKIGDDDLEKICSQLKGYPLAIDFAILLLSEGVTSSEIIYHIVQGNDAGDVSERLLNAIFTRPDATIEEKEFIKIFSVFTSGATHLEISAIMPANIVAIAPRKLQKKNLLSISNSIYEIHPLVREFCYKELSDKINTHAKVAEYYISQRTEELSPSLEEQIFFHLSKSEQWDRIEGEIENKGRQFILQGQLGLVKELLDKLKSIGIEKPVFNILYGDIAEIQGKWEIAQEFFNAAQLNASDDKIQIQGVIKYGEMLYRKGESRNALSYFTKAYNSASGDSLLKEKARACNDIGLIEFSFGNLELALEKYSESLKIRKTISDNEGIATSLFNIGRIYQTKGELLTALENFEKASEIEKTLDNKSGIASALDSFGAVYGIRGDHEKALRFFNESIEIKRTIGATSGIADSLALIGGVLAEKGKLDEALSKHLESLQISKDIGDKSGIAGAMNDIGNIYVEKNEYSLALKEYEESYLLCVETGDQSAIAITLNNIGNLFKKQGKLDEALKKLELSLEIKQRIGNRYSIASTYLNIGSLFLAKKQYDLATINIFKSYSLYNYVGAPTNTLKALEWILAIRDDNLGIEKFKPIATHAYNNLSLEMQKNLPIKEFLKEPIQRDQTKVGRNDPCPCGSGKKYKNCHGQNPN